MGLGSVGGHVAVAEKIRRRLDSPVKIGIGRENAIEVYKSFFSILIITAVKVFLKCYHYY